MKVDFRKVLAALEKSNIEAIATSKNDSWNQIIARDNPQMDFSTWFIVDENQQVEVEDDFFDLYG
jgi:hypothetical protein